MLQDRIGAPDVAVVPIVAVLGAVVPFGQVTSMGVTVVPARRLVGLLRQPATDADAAAGAGGGRADEPAHRHLHQPLMRNSLLLKAAVWDGGSGPHSHPAPRPP